MDFNSIGAGSPFYIHTKREGQEPTLEVGVVKEKVLQQPQYLQAVPGAMNGMGMPQMARITVTVNGVDRVIPEVPTNVEVAQKGNVTYSGSPQAIMQVVDAMMQGAKAELEREDYNKMVIAAGEKHMEILNPRYAEEKERDRSIRKLQERANEQDKKLDNIASQNKQILNFLQELNGSSASRAK